MKKCIAIILVATLLVLIFVGCNKSNEISTPFDVKTGDVFTIRVSMEDSGAIKSMALSIYSDDEAFEILDGKWLNQKAVIADFNKENKDAAIAFKDDINYHGEVFEFTVKAKKELTVIDNIFEVEPILKNEQNIIKCKGLTISFIKE